MAPKLNPATHQKSTLAPKQIFGCLLVPPWFPFGSPWLPFGALWLPCDSLLAPYGALWFPCGCIFVPFCNLFTTMPLFGATFAPFCTIPNLRKSNFIKLLVFVGTRSRNAPATDSFVDDVRNHCAKKQNVLTFSARTRR